MQDLDKWCLRSHDKLIYIYTGPCVLLRSLLLTHSNWIKHSTLFTLCYRIMVITYIKVTKWQNTKVCLVKATCMTYAVRLLGFLVVLLPSMPNILIHFIQSTLTTWHIFCGQDIYCCFCYFDHMKIWFLEYQWIKTIRKMRYADFSICLRRNI